jgi:hypothetical protein
MQTNSLSMRDETNMNMWSYDNTAPLVFHNHTVLLLRQNHFHKLHHQTASLNNNRLKLDCMQFHVFPLFLRDDFLRCKAT